MAKFKSKIPSLDAVPEAQREFYTQHDSGDYVLDVEPVDGWGLENIAALRGKLDATTTDLERQKKRLQGFAKEDGSLYTPEEIAALSTDLTARGKEIENLRSKDKSADDKIRDAVAQAKGPILDELNKIKASSERYKKAAQDGYRDKVKGEVLSHLKPQDEWRDMISRDLDARIEIIEREDGSFTHAFVKDGNKLMSAKQGFDGPMTADEFAAGDYRQQFARCLEGDGKKGAGIGGKTTPASPRQGASGVELQPGYTQEQFEKAVNDAADQGLEVVMPSGDGRGSE